MSVEDPRKIAAATHVRGRHEVGTETFILVGKVVTGGQGVK
jgi:hypothetical protein